MKEAFIIDPQGKYIEPTLVMDSMTGVFDIVEQVEISEGTTPPSEPRMVVTGYTVAVTMPDGLYEPIFDVAGYRAAEAAYVASYAIYQKTIAAHNPDSGVPLPLPPEQIDGTKYWRNGLTQAEIDTLQPKPQPNTVQTLGEQLVARELEVIELKAQNDAQGATLVALELRLLQLEGAGKVV
ncbi:hypothetical protein [Paenibacillus agilis]|uniref:Bacteriophage SP-beta YorD domain-containing protein n=1 Tax=Paenibacillus agilis TaxID=3020863 RepID=A0A559IW99_9BACL|nr:hypothetical protein [Paenibacillus agilis]TVX91912.1 hypothetical protein FPZ44_01840 [Paenibacillus agilis]